MNDRAIISICIPVYNQIDLVEKFLNKVIECESDEIEVIINDDQSTDDIEGLVRKYKDTRLKYFRNVENKGHDRNILESFRNAQGEYVYLFRVRDYVVKEGIQYLLNFIKNNDGLSYITTNAYDSHMNPKLVYKNKIYIKGIDALNANNTLYIHPSGSLYKREFIPLEALDNHLKETDATKYNFTVHSLLRTYLAEIADFATIDVFSWIYSDTRDSKDTAVNSSKKEISVYDTVYQLERYKTEFLWVAKVMPNEHVENQLLYVFKQYLYATTWNNKLLYEDKKSRDHYSYKYKKINCKNESQKLIDLSKELERNYNLSEYYFNQKKRVIFENNTKGCLKYYYVKLRMSFPCKKMLKKIAYGIFKLRKRY